MGNAGSTRVRETFKICSIIAATALVVGLAAPVAAGAANKLMSIVDADGDSAAQVDAGKLRVGDGDGELTVDGDVTARPQDVSQYVHGAGAVFSQNLCTPVLVPPADQALVLQTLAVSVRRSTTSELAFIGFYTASNCNSGYVTNDPATSAGIHTINFEPGFVIEAGRGLYMVAVNDVHASATATGYLVPAAAVTG